MPLTNYALDTFVSQQLSQLTSCRPRSVAADFPKCATWLDQFILRRMFQAHIGEDRAALAFALVRRAESAIDEWELACKEVSGDVRRPSNYFRALRHFENCLAAVWQGLDFGRRSLDLDLFDEDEPNAFERLNSLYNKARHFEPQKLPAGALHPLWLTNDALRSHEHTVTFDELRDAISLLGRIAQELAEGLTT